MGNNKINSPKQRGSLSQMGTPVPKWVAIHYMKKARCKSISMRLEGSMAKWMLNGFGCLENYAPFD